MIKVGSVGYESELNLGIIGCSPGFKRVPLACFVKVDGSTFTIKARGAYFKSLCEKVC